jgi:ATP-dependent DNA helicase RecG
MSTPSNEDILALLDQLATCTADDLESQWVDFKPWNNAKEDMKIAVEYAVCLANTDGGVIVFGVADEKRGREAAIHGARGYDIDIWRRGIYAATVPNVNVTVEELSVPEGTGKLLIVRVPRGTTPPYGTTQGLYKKRIGKNCMPLDPAGFAQKQVNTGAVDWSGQPADDVGMDALDPMEIERARTILKSKNPESELLKMQDASFLEGLEAVRGGRVTNAGLLLLGRADIIAETCPQNQIHYVYQISDTAIARNDLMRGSLLSLIERIEQIFNGPANLEEELSIGLFKLRIPAFPLEVVREAVLNAITHRDYSNPGEILIRQAKDELAITSPGGFIGGITVHNILRHEAMARNRTLANAFVKLRLVESAGTGRRRIFIPMLGFGKRIPRYESDGSHVTLRLFDGSYDQRMARLVNKWKNDGRDIDLDALLVLAYLKANAFIDSKDAASLLQLPRDAARSVLDQLALPQTGIVERRGQTKAATYHLARGVARDLLGKAAYTRTRPVDTARYAEIVRQYVVHHGSITPQECREVLYLGDSATARVQVSRYLKQWSSKSGFLRMEGRSPKNRYVLAEEH